MAGTFDSTLHEIHANRRRFHNNSCIYSAGLLHETEQYISYAVRPDSSSQYCLSNDPVDAAKCNSNVQTKFCAALKPVMPDLVALALTSDAIARSRLYCSSKPVERQLLVVVRSLNLREVSVFLTFRPRLEIQIRKSRRQCFA